MKSVLIRRQDRSSRFIKKRCPWATFFNEAMIKNVCADMLNYRQLAFSKSELLFSISVITQIWIDRFLCLSGISKSMYQLMPGVIKTN